MKIDVGELRREIGSKKHVEFDQPVETGIPEVALAGPVRVSLDLLYTGKEVLGSFRVKGTIRGKCARCLKEMEVPLEVSFSEEFKNVSEQRPGDEDDYFPYHGDELDPTEAIRQNVILAIPPRLLCDPGCKGLCPYCGVDLNIGQCECKGEEVDPRWAALDALIDRSKRKERG